MKKALGFLKGFFSTYLTWVGLGVAAPYFQLPLSTLTMTTILFWVLGRNFASWEFREEELASYRRLKKKRKSKKIASLLDLLTLLGAFAGICYNTFYIISTSEIKISGDIFLIFFWLLLMVLSCNLYVVTQRRYNGYKRALALLYLSITLVLMYINHDINFAQFQLVTA